MDRRTIPRVESTEEMQRLQNDLVQRLATTAIDPDRYATLADCTPGRCACRECIEPCWFGARRRRLKELPAAYRLLNRFEGAVFEIRIARSRWVRPIGQLWDLDPVAAKRWNRLALDSLLYPGLVSIGMFKLSLVTDDSPHWVGEIYQLVAGATQEDLERIFPYNIYAPKLVTDLGARINEVLRRELQTWEPIPLTVTKRGQRWQTVRPNDLSHYRLSLSSSSAKKVHRTECYKWLLNLSKGARLIRYGCDRNFNRLKKQPRTIKIKPKKRRPYPHWLVPFQYGNRPPN